jgi:hypothetical protein
LKVLSATSVLFVDRVEPTRDFFVRAGFNAIVEIPAGEALGFAILEKDGVQVMEETRGNAAELTYEEPGGNLITFAKIAQRS